MLFFIFLLVTLAVTGLYAFLAPAVTVWRVLGVALLAWLGANLLLVLLFVVNWLFLPRLGPDEGIERQRPLSRWIVTNGARWLCGYAGVKVTLSGTEKLPDTPFLLVSNHRAGFDPLVAIGWLGPWNIAFISKPGNFDIPLVGLTTRHAGYLAIDRDNDRAALKTILRAADYLKRGVCSIGIYPEGTRNRTDAPLLPFHAGSFKIAQKAGVPLAIVCMRGTDRVLRTPFFIRTPVYLDVLEVLDAETVKRMKTVELAEYARRIMEEDLKK